MWKGDKGDEGLCCWLPASSTVCAGDSFQQSRYNPNTKPPGTEYRNAVGTKYCPQGCGSVSDESLVISKAMYDSLRYGGKYTVSAQLSENNSWHAGTNCNFSKSENGVLPQGNCGAEFVLRSQACSSDSTQNDFAHIGFGYRIGMVGNQYRMAYGIGFIEYSPDYPPMGWGAWCPYKPPGWFSCYSVGFYIGYQYDNFPGFMWCRIPGDGITITTSAGTLGPFGIYTFCGFQSASASFSITINEFTS